MAVNMRSANRTVQQAGSDAASSRWMEWLARAGLVARGVNYVLIGILAVQIGLGGGGKEADRNGALHAIAEHPGGTLVLWLLAVGFGGLSVWRLAEAAYGQADPDGHKATKRLASLARGIFYAFVCVSIAGFLLSVGGQSSSNKQSKDFTARLMGYTGGRWLVLLIGVIVTGAAVGIVVGAIRKTFRKHLKLGQMSPQTRKVVETLGAIGYAARGVVFGVVGVFLAVAAINFDPKQSQGIDGALRKLATTPLGPWLLIAVALGLVTFGVYSCCEARWRKVRPGRGTQHA
ncbi:MAG: hypothetical protein JWL58_2601 [Streptosporangiaceae bacterium]|jgi:hypothetical protein|nr:hypothetical protein [Streptosporangiaceae bacterium]